MMKTFLFLLFILNGALPLFAESSADGRLGSRIDLSIPFHREDGKTVSLDSLAAGRPSLLAMTYFSCPNLCPILLRSLAETLSKVPSKRMAKTNLIIVSFDPHEGPMKATEQRKQILSYLPADVPQSQVYFLSGSLFSIDRLAKDLSFELSWDESSKTYAHASSLAVLSGKGRIISFFDGLDFPPERIEKSLLQAENEKPLSGWDRFLIACAEGQLLGHKDSSRILFIVRSVSAAFLLFTGLFIGIGVTRGRRTSA